MRNQLKMLGMFLVFLAGLLVTINSVAADYTFQEIEVNGVETAGTVYAERGETVEIRVELISDEDSENTRVKAWIGGYEYEDVEDKTSIFDMEADVVYVKHLFLEIPDDIDVEDDGYKLHVVAYNDDGEKEETYFILRIKETRHKLAIQDIILRPEISVNAGRPLFVTVRVENMGAKKEEDIKVTVSIPDLGISTRTYIDELVPEDDPLYDEESSASSNELFLRIPEDAETGDYDVVVELKYNRGHDVVEETERIYVEGVEKEVVEALVSVDATVKELAQGEEIAYKLLITNTGTSKAVYSVVVDGERLWAISRVEPSSMVVEPDTSAEVYLYLKANENAAVGRHVFTVKVMENTNVVKEMSLAGDVSKEEVVTAFSWQKVRTGLEIGFIVLIVVLIILGIAIAARRLGRPREEEAPAEAEAPATKGKTYY